MKPATRVLLVGTTARVLPEGFALAVVFAVPNPAVAGVLIGCATLPQIVTGPLSGQILDRARRPGWITAAACVFAAAATLALGAATPIALAAALTLAVVTPVLTGGLSAIFTTWVALDDVHSVSAWDGVAYNVAGLAAPVLVTVVATTASPKWALIALALATLGAAAVVFGAPAAATATTTATMTEPSERSGGLAAARALRAMWVDRPLRSVTIATTIDHIGVGALSLALAAAALSHGHPVTAAGLVVSVRALSALAGSLILTRYGRSISPPTMVLVGLVVTGAATVLMGSVAWPVLVGLGVVIGVSDGPVLVATYRARSTGAPDDIRASVFTVGSSLKLGASSIGALVAGATLDGRATPNGLVGVGAVSLVAVLAGRLALGRGHRLAVIAERSAARSTAD